MQYLKKTLLAGTFALTSVAGYNAAKFPPENTYNPYKVYLAPHTHAVEYLKIRFAEDSTNILPGEENQVVRAATIIKDYGLKNPDHTQSVKIQGTDGMCHSTRMDFEKIVGKQHADEVLSGTLNIDSDPEDGSYVFERYDNVDQKVRDDVERDVRTARQRAYKVLKILIEQGINPDTIEATYHVIHTGGTIKGNFIVRARNCSGLDSSLPRMAKISAKNKPPPASNGASNNTIIDLVPNG